MVPRRGASNSRKEFRVSEPWAREVSWLEPVAPHLGDLQLLVNVAINESQTSTTSNNPPSIHAAPVTSLGVAPRRVRLAAQQPPSSSMRPSSTTTPSGIFRLLYNTIGSTVVARNAIPLRHRCPIS
jgi:hypothetical protein